MKRQTIHHINRKRDAATAGMVIAAGGLLIESAKAAFNPPPEISVAGVVASQAFVTDLLDAAKARGYKHYDSLATKLLSGQPSFRLEEMARTACRYAGMPTVLKLVKRLESIQKNKPENGGEND